VNSVPVRAPERTDRDKSFGLVDFRFIAHTRVAVIETALPQLGTLSTD
jgi:hypothetical protein